MAQANFQKPSREFGLIPFWWWVGEPLDRERIAWQLDRMKEMGIHRAIVSYNHHADGNANHGTPAVFSDEWWELLRWVTAECKARGMQIGSQDYTLLNPLLQEIGEETPEMSGGSLRENHVVVTNGESCQLSVAEGCGALLACAYPIRDAFADPCGRLDLTERLVDGRLTWTAPDGCWLVSLVSIDANPFDPMDAESGAKVIERYYRPLEDHLKEDLGGSFSVSFQDELDFGSRMPLWSGRLMGEFATRKGYELAPLLPALWNDLGPVSAKLRIDYSDVTTALLEESYFIPVFDWHKRHGLLFGNDNCGRGGIAAGREHYGDAFRTMRWYSAPGTDDPNLDGARAFKALKVFSSIAHLYQRPRVWCECFHSSGWGARPADVVAALNENFLYGATVVNLHGLYYSTYGSWWEWASPDFHFRQPYARHMKTFASYVTRICQTLSQGVHVCDVAILYPITAIEAGLNPLVAEEEIAYSEWQAGHQVAVVDEAEALAFGLGRHLVGRGIDFDFIDFQSLERADVSSGEIQVSGESYRIMILAGMSAVRFSTLSTALDLVMAGGTVIAFGCLPVASERAGMDDPEVDDLVRRIFGSSAKESGRQLSVCENASGGKGVFIPGNYREVEEMICQSISRDFDPAGSGVCALHRRTESKDIYYLFNPRKDAVEAEMSFRATGAARRWDAWTGSQTAIGGISVAGGISCMKLRMESGESRLVVFDRSRSAAGDEVGKMAVVSAGEDLVLSGLWEFELVPTMDNRFGDFRIPVEQEMIGAEARRFFYQDEGLGSEMWHRPDFDDTGWPRVTASYGQRFWKLGPFPAGTDLAEIEAALRALDFVDPSIPFRANGIEHVWTPYEFSQRWGIEDDPHLKDWASGPHGLKGEVPDEFIDLPGGESGAAWFLWTSVQASEPRSLRFVMGSRCRYAAWLNHMPVVEQDIELPPGLQSMWDLPHYQSEPRGADVSIRSGSNPLLLKFYQAVDQRLRAYAAFDLPRRDGLALRWFNDADHPVFNCRPDQPVHAGWYRFSSPPGLAALTMLSKGPVRAWGGGLELVCSRMETREDGSIKFRFTIPNPSRGMICVAIRVEQPPESFGGDSLPEPVALECIAGEINLGDWSACGLQSYSGAAWYRRTIDLTADQARHATELDLGSVAVTAEVHVNGRPAATLITPPWRTAVAGLLHEGRNEIAILVANTLANHYSVGIPTPYVFEGQAVSGLLGPVSIRIQSSSIS